VSQALIVLASGLSSRFEGGQKLLAALEGKPVLQHVIETLAEVRFDSRYAVVANKDIENHFKTAGYICIRNDKPEAGQGHSLSLGAKGALENGHDKVCVALADMPRITADHISELLHDNAPVAMSEHRGVIMPPAVFSRAVLTRLAEATGDKGAKGQLDLQNVTTIALSDRAACDIDTLEDLDKAL
jgi:CTP:molybdopterin cytidylyltransferase MocA